MYTGANGAQLLWVGDVAAVAIRMINQLPSPVQLSAVMLHLTLLQPTSGVFNSSLVFMPPTVSPTVLLRVRMNLCDEDGISRYVVNSDASLS